MTGLTVGHGLLRCLPALAAAVSIVAGGTVAFGQSPARTAQCDMLDDPLVLGLASQAFLWRLQVRCGLLAPFPAEGGDLSPFPADPLAPQLGTDTQINNSGGDAGNSTTQSETSVVLDGMTVCAAWNDSQHYVAGTGFSGFGNSLDYGSTWTDRGAIPTGAGGTQHSYGDPSLAYRAFDDTIYFASLSEAGLGLWKSVDGCTSFAFAGNIHSGTDDDKEILTIDNTGGAYHGRMYVVWTDFGVGRIALTYSNDAMNWSAPQYLSSLGTANSVQGAWPAVAPNGDLYVAWAYMPGYPTGTRDMQVARCIPGDSGMTCSQVTSAATGLDSAGHSAVCGFFQRQVLDGDIRYLDSPQIAVGPDGRVHIVYSYDWDGAGTAEVGIEHRYSDNQGASWSLGTNPSADVDTNDKFFPTLAVNENNAVHVAWYDRREDPSNLLFRRWMAFSYDGATGWDGQVLIGDTVSPVPPIKPKFDPVVATCYMGDYDQIAMNTALGFHIWSDSRNTQNGHDDPDIFADWVENPLTGKADYNAEGNEDIGVFRNGMWFMRYSPDFAGTDLATAFGSPTPGVDEPQIGEFDCSGALGKPDGKTDLAILRKATSTWQANLSSAGWPPAPALSVTLGTTAHKRIATRRLDTNFDGCSDIGVFRNGCFYVQESPDYSGGIDRTVCFGLGTDEPLAGDVNGDGWTDLGLWRPSGAFYWDLNLPFDQVPDIAINFGTTGDVPAIGDINKDGAADLGVYRPSSSTFFFTFSPDYAGDVDMIKTHGVAGDIPIIADVNGDAQVDIGVWRNSVARWFFLCSPGYVDICVDESFGVAGDVPIYGKSGLP